MSKVKYKKGTRKVLMVTDVTNNTNKSDYHEGTRLIVTEFSEGSVHRFYLECDEDEQFNKGDLIAAVCIKTHFKDEKMADRNYNITDWKRIS